MRNLDYLVTVGQRRGARILFLALAANNPDRIGTGNLQIVFFAQFIQLFEMNTGHGYPRLGGPKGH